MKNISSTQKNFLLITSFETINSPNKKQAKKQNENEREHKNNEFRSCKEYGWVLTLSHLHHRTHRRLQKYGAKYIWKWGKMELERGWWVKNLKKERDPPRTLPNTAQSGDSPSSSPRKVYSLGRVKQRVSGRGGQCVLLSAGICCKRGKYSEQI